MKELFIYIGYLMLFMLFMWVTLCIIGAIADHYTSSPSKNPKDFSDYL